MCALATAPVSDRTSRGTYLDAIRALDFALQNRDHYGIRVLNLSVSADPRSHYWDDPLNQAVMAARRADSQAGAMAINNWVEQRE